MDPFKSHSREENPRRDVRLQRGEHGVLSGFNPRARAGRDPVKIEWLPLSQRFNSLALLVDRGRSRHSKSHEVSIENRPVFPYPTPDLAINRATFA